MDQQSDRPHRPRGRAVPPPAVERVPIQGAGERIEYVRQLCADPTTPLWRIDEAYVEAIRPELVPRSWEFYRQEGRGIIMLDFGARDLRHMAADDVTPCYYVSEAVRRQRGVWWPEELCQMVLEYDPAHEMIIVVFHTTSPHVFRLMRVDQPAAGHRRTSIWYEAKRPKGPS
jgi:hypothetical protein